ncbi:hypothetical protein C464_06230 [Halorubrum coriense DSM 10284]|uniref:Uncharacterized protein n=1 Tax=Halorubrum coriense DSM 10284 TaxID=1227466 RepID=M0EMJ4_9EURY|nr:hypothetical protein [Halorubrum coriense]ELZ48986.1 hypothetical protein C464_06230 [Halorubrum coriense DSM 10284]QRG24119.1 hypothetical protein HrrHm1_040 [Halorubrum virus Humcor1]
MSDDTIRVRVDRGDYFHEREHYTRGDELEVALSALEKHPNSLTRVDDPDASTAKEGADTTDSDDEIVVDPDPSDLTVDELRDRIDDVDDVDLLEAIKDAEEEGKNRETATDALKQRIRSLRG